MTAFTLNSGRGAGVPPVPSNSPGEDASAPAAPFDLDCAVAEFYQPLLRFAASLAGNATDAADLAQQTFYIAQTRGHQLRDPRRLKTWLFTTLRREFLQRRRHETRFPKVELTETVAGPDRVGHIAGRSHDEQAALVALESLAETFRVPLRMFYLEERSYAEIARLIGRPIGTVMSRLARGREQLRKRLEARPASGTLRPAMTRITVAELAFGA